MSDKNVDLEFEALLRASAQVAADYDSNLLADISTPDQVAERAALRRIAGFSTQLQDISDAEYRELQLEKVVLIGVWTEGTSEMAENSLAELKALSETAGAEVLEGVIQRRESPDPATYIGSGKVQELRELVARTGADTVIRDGHSNAILTGPAVIVKDVDIEEFLER